MYLSLKISSKRFPKRSSKTFWLWVKYKLLSFTLYINYCCQQWITFFLYWRSSVHLVPTRQPKDFTRRFNEPNRRSSMNSLMQCYMYPNWRLKYLSTDLRECFARFSIKWQEIVENIIPRFYLCRAKYFGLWVVRPWSLAVQLPLLNTHTFKRKRIDKVK